jgi:hypothetical protein
VAGSTDAEHFHLELRQGLHQGRAFNLLRPELESRFLDAWRDGRAVVLDERRYAPGRAKLRVLRGAALRPEEIGLGRGWQNAERAGVDVTDALLREPPVPASGSGPAPGTLVEFKLAVEGACALEPRALHEIVELAALRHPGSRVSERLALAEQAVWELLHEDRLALWLDREEEPVAREGWQQVLLSWEGWAGGQETTSASIRSRSEPGANR